MKTREQIYGKEAASLLRDITTYHCMRRKQILRLYPEKESKIENLLQYLVRQGRAFYNEKSGCYYDRQDFDTDTEMLAALWVLVDFIDRTEYHTAGEHPVQITFFASGEVYEVVYVSAEKAALITQALAGKEEEMGQRLLILDSPGQMEALNIPNTAAYCLVDTDGRIQYFKKE